MSADDSLKERKIISVKDAAAAAGGVDQRTWLNRMAERNIPVLRLGPRKRGMFLSHFDQMILSFAEPARESGAGIPANYDWLNDLASTEIR